MSTGEHIGTEEAFHALVSDLDYPMFVATVAAHGERSGCLIGFVTQASIDPARVLVLISKVNRTYQLTQESDTMVVHFLHRDNHDLAALFGTETGDDVDKFAACEWSEGPDQTPILSGTRGWVVGKVIGRLDAGDHVAHLLDVRDASVDRPGDPLAFQAVRRLQPGHPA